MTTKFGFEKNPITRIANNDSLLINCYGHTAKDAVAAGILCPLPYLTAFRTCID
jgi:hypothetical protein